jgi:preprotein translocase subunit SecG
MLYKSLIVFHVILAAGIIGLVLLQKGKGADTGAAFGGGASGTVFGAQGSASFLSRTTAVLAALFFANSLALAYMAGQVPAESSSIIQRAAQEQMAEEATVTPDALPLIPDDVTVEDSADDLPTVPVGSSTDEAGAAEMSDLPVDEAAEPTADEGADDADSGG